MDDEYVLGALPHVLEDIAREREAQDRHWGPQEFPDGTGPAYVQRAEEAKADCTAAHTRGELTWRHILAEEFFEALAESDPRRLRAELIQTAAVAVQWIQSIDRRTRALPHQMAPDSGPTASTGQTKPTLETERTEAAESSEPSGRIEPSQGAEPTRLTRGTEPTATAAPSGRTESPPRHRDARQR